MIRDAKTAEDFERLANYFDYQSLVFEQKAGEQVNELERLLALRYHARSYPIQVDHTRELIKECELREDDKALVLRMRAVHALCNDAGDVATASLLENWIDQAQRRVWFLFESTRI